MATSVTFNGTTYSVPNTVGESGWGGSLTAYLVALASGAAVTSTVKQTVRVAVTTPITVSNTTDYTVISKLTSPGAVAVNLPAGATGRFFAVVDGTGDAGTNNITIDGNGAETINGSATHVINENYGGVVLAWNGTQWNIVSQFVGDSPSFTNVTVTGTATVGTLAATTISGGTLSGVTIDGDSNTIQDLAITSLKTVLGDANKVLRRNASGVPESGLLVNANVDAAAAIDATKIADGTVTSTEFQYINSLSSNAQTQITNNLNTLTTHTGASTGVHGVTGSVVGTSDSQTLTNKLISSTSAVTGALTLPTGTVAERPSPTAGMIRYNSDNAEFEGYANSAWQAVGGGINERPLKNYLKSYAQAVVAPGTLSTLASTISNLVSLTAFYADATSGSAALTSSSSTTLRGSTNYLTATGTSEATGARFVQFPAFSLDGTDLGKPVSISFDVNNVTADGNWDVVVVRYNSSGTYQEIISVAGNASSGTTPVSAKLPTGTSTFNGFFIPGSTAGDLYALRLRSLVGTVQIRVDTLFVGPQPVRVGAAVTDWQSYTPTFNGFGTVVTSAVQYRRNGDSIDVRGYFTTATVDAGDARVGLPAGLTIAGLASLTPSGRWQRTSSSATTVKGGPAIALTGNSYINFSFDDYTSAASAFTNRSGSGITGSSEVFGFYIFGIPVANWSSNITMADRSVEEYAWNSSSSTTTTDTTSFANGTGGALIRSITASLIRRVRFQSTIQATDAIIVEVSPDQLRWFQMSNGYTDNTSFSVSNFQQQNTTLYGLGYPKVINSTDVDVNFGQYSDANGATYASAGRAWSSGGGALYWRVRKVSGGAQVGYPIASSNIVGRVDGNAPASGYIGEQIRSAQLSNTAFPATNVYGDLVSISLTPGVWDISAILYVDTSGVTITEALCAITSTSGNSSAGTSPGDNVSYIASSLGSGRTTTSIPSYRVLLTSTTSYYLKYSATYSAGTPQARGRISAVRIA